MGKTCLGTEFVIVCYKVGGVNRPVQKSGFSSKYRFPLWCAAKKTHFNPAKLPKPLDVRPSLRSPTPDAAPVRGRHGYDRRWWARARRAEAPASESYWRAVRSPLAGLLLVAPLLVTYELGVLWLERGGTRATRAGIDVWIRDALGRAGVEAGWIPPAILLLGLLAWQSAAGGACKPRPRYLLGMIAESLAFAALLVGLSRLVDLGLTRLEGNPAPPGLAQGSVGAWQAPYLGYIGAGIYEEATFRLLLIPLAVAMMRACFVPRTMAGALAICASALVFSLAHHFGAPGESFTWFAFIFRWFAGLYFAWLFVARGFGIAVGAHVAYDLFAGLLGSQ